MVGELVITQSMVTQQLDENLRARYQELVRGLEVLARGLKAAAAMIEDGTYDAALEERYAGWQSREAKAMLNGKRSLEQIAARVEKQNINPEPKSGRQEYLENLVNRFV